MNILDTGWVKDGRRVTANYLGETVSGLVENSRVRYGGKVEYTVVLDKPVQFRWRDEPSWRVLVAHDALISEVV